LSVLKVSFSIFQRALPPRMILETFSSVTSDCVKTIGQHRIFYKIDSSFS
jgi:hypothetical protein